MIKFDTKSRWFWIGSSVALVMVLDQWTKVLARKYVSDAIPVSYFNNSLVFIRSQNPGAFLSLGASLDERTRFWIFTVMVILILAGVAWTLIKDQKMGFWSTLSLSFLLGGGLANLIDRIFVGSVTDFINIGYGTIRSGIFNVADMAITAGAIAMLLMSFRRTKN